MPSEVLYVRVSDDVMARIDRLVTATGWTKRQVVEYLLRTALKLPDSPIDDAIAMLAGEP